MNITDTERKLFGSLLWDALATTAPEQWSDYEATVATFCKVATDSALQGRYDDICKAGAVTVEMQAIGAELAQRANDSEDFS